MEAPSAATRWLPAPRPGTVDGSRPNTPPHHPHILRPRSPRWKHLAGSIRQPVRYNCVPMPPITETHLRVRYAETDQMGVVYYANYLIWMEVARVDLCRACGFNYRDMERDDGVLL